MQIGQRIALIGMLVSATLACMKITAGYLGHSTSVLADGFESGADVLASGTILLALVLAARPADSNHPYGHGRIETLAGLLLGFVLFSAGIAISAHALTGVSDVKELPASYTIWPLIVSAIVKLVMMRYKYATARRIMSGALIADAANDGIDAISGFAALIAVSLTLSYPERFPHADHYGAFFVGLIVIFTGVRVVRETGMQLMDTMPDPNMMKLIREVAGSVDGVDGVEKCFARKTGFKYHVDLHLEVDPGMTVKDSHDIAQRVREKIRDELNWVADVLVHVEPAPRMEHVR
ncbi:MAG TPA: cation diffusion facilitator family transporter [Bryobacteraceae bacterium]|jgi:cation diffusion facilitator family transporter